MPLTILITPACLTVTRCGDTSFTGYIFQGEIAATKGKVQSTALETNN
jgi:hypothetical protein